LIGGLRCANPHFALSVIAAHGHHAKDFAVFHVEPIEKLGLCLSDYPHVLMDMNQIPTASQSLNGLGLVCDRDKEILFNGWFATLALG
jgi:hypothetical protein